MNDRKSRRGFASLSFARRQEISSKGGKAAQARGTAHRWDSESARAATQKGWDRARGIRREDQGANIGGGGNALPAAAGAGGGGMPGEASAESGGPGGGASPSD